MTRAVHGAPAAALGQALETLAGLAFWISWTADPDPYPDAGVGTRSLREAAGGLREAARRLDDAADRLDAFDRNAIDA